MKTSCASSHEVESKKDSRYFFKKQKNNLGFTLIELVLVIIIIAVMYTVVARGTGTFGYWKEESFFRHIREVMTFLHSQAIADQAYYRLEFDTKNNQYRVGVLREESEGGNSSSAPSPDCSEDVGTLTCDLAFFISPALPDNFTLIPPPSYPSLFEPENLPPGITLVDIIGGAKTVVDGTKAIDFSPQNSSSGALISFKAERGADFTIMYNPFTGATEFAREKLETSEYLPKQKQS